MGLFHFNTLGKEGRPRICVNSKRFNAAMIPGKYSLSRTNECIKSLEESKVIVALDALLLHCKAPFKDGKNDKTIFIFNLGTYSYTRIPSTQGMSLMRFNAH